MRPLYIFDIDGTLCNIEHRLHFLEDKTDKGRWKKFYAACTADVPNKPVIHTLGALADAGADIWLFSGRSEEVRNETIDWLHRYANNPFNEARMWGHPELLTMRPRRDFTEDHLMKEKWLHGMFQVDRERLAGVFEDRKRVADMWRANGITCFQVAPGEF